jgi:hypothetical protein
MNEFQNQLQKVISEINKASQRVVLSEKVDQLDLDVLLERIRKAYSLVIDLEVVQEMEQMPKVVMLEKEPVFEMVQHEDIKLEEVEQEEIEQEEIKQVVVEQVVVEPEVEVVLEQNIELEREDYERFDEVEQEQLELMVEDAPIEKKDEIPSVLRYLNEQMPKASTFSPLHIKIEDEVKEIQPELVVEEEKAIEIVVEQEVIEEKKIEEPKIEEKREEVVQELFFEAPVEEAKPISNGKSIGEQYEQKKSIFENFSTNIKQDDISKRFNSPKIDLRTAIGVNEKFMFINDLFSGNLREYTDFIQRLNEAETLEMANVILNAEKENKRWVANSLSYGTLTEILAKKFH